MHRKDIVAVDLIDVSSLIYIVRGEQVILDSDLAFLYGTTTSAFNQAINRNLNRFPEGFRFQLTREEYASLKQTQQSRAEARNAQTLTSQNVISKTAASAKTLTKAMAKPSARTSAITSAKNLIASRGGRRYLPYVFTEEGVAMLSGILRSDIAVRTSIHIMRSFVEMRHFITKHAALFEHIKSLELQQLEHQRETDARFAQLFDLIETRSHCPQKDQKIFFEGQIYDAHSFLVRMIKRAKKEIILVDGYVNINTLDILVNKAKGVDVKILTLPSSTISKNEIKKFSTEYPTLELIKTNAFHDRFMIFDHQDCYHIGASLKDAGEKCFAITKLEESHELSKLYARIDEEISKKDLQKPSRS